MSERVVSDFNKSLRNQFTAITLLFALAYSTFYLGWGQMRYSPTTLIPMEKFVYWRFAMAGWLPLVAFIVTCLFVVRLMMSVSGGKAGKVRGLAFVSGVHLVVCFLALVWSLIFCAWSIVTWTECNDPGPKHPECRNRQYPEETVADYSFIMMVISSAVMAGIMFWCLYFNSMVGIMRKALVTEFSEFVESRLPTVSDNGVFSSKKDKKKYRKAVSKPFSFQTKKPSSSNWMSSQGVN